MNFFIYIVIFRILTQGQLTPKYLFYRKKVISTMVACGTLYFERFLAKMQTTPCKHDEMFCICGWLVPKVRVELTRPWRLMRISFSSVYHNAYIVFLRADSHVQYCQSIRILTTNSKMCDKCVPSFGGDTWSTLPLYESYIRPLPESMIFELV